MIVVSHNWFDQDTRLVAIDRANGTHGATRFSHMIAADTVNQSIYVFKDLKPDEIKQFEFQVREFEWTTVDNLPAAPKPPKDAKATISGRILLADGSPHRGTGSLYYVQRDNSGSGHSGLLEEGVADRFSGAVVPGTVWLKYFADGYAPAWKGPFTLAAGAHLDDIKLTLEEGFSATLQVKSSTGEPIENVQIVALPRIGDDATGASPTITGGSDGRFELTHLADVPYALNARAPGYQSGFDQYRKIRSGETVTLELKKARLSGGVVVDESGQPLADATISLRASAHEGELSIYNDDTTTKTDLHGRFTLDQLQDDRWYQYVVESQDGAKAALPLLQAGQTDIRVAVSPRIDVRIRIVGDVGRLPLRNGRPVLNIRQPFKFEPVKNATVFDLFNKYVSVTPTAEGGFAECGGLMPGELTLWIGNRGYPFGRITESQEITLTLDPSDGVPANGTRTNPKPPADAKATISGRIVLADGSPATREGMLHYQHLDRNGNTTMGTADRFTDRFTLTIPAGTVRLAFFADDFAPAIAGPFDLEPGQQLADVRLMLREGVTWYLDFENEDGDPVPAEVVAVPALGNGSSGPAIPHKADAHGTLALSHLTQEAAYKLSVSAPGYQPLSTTLPTNTSVPGPPDAPLKFKLRMARPATGILLSPGGAPAKGAALRMRVAVFGHSTISRPEPREVRVDEDGHFSIDQLRKGAYYLVMAEAADGAKVMLPPVQAGQSDIRVAIPPRRDLKIRVIGDLDKLQQRKGKPILGVRQRYQFHPAEGIRYGDLIGGDVFVEATDDGGSAEYRGLIDVPVEITAGKQVYHFDQSEGEVTIRLDPQPERNSSAMGDFDRQTNVRVPGPSA